MKSLDCLCSCPRVQDSWVLLSGLRYVINSIDSLRIILSLSPDVSRSSLMFMAFPMSQSEYQAIHRFEPEVRKSLSFHVRGGIGVGILCYSLYSLKKKSGHILEENIFINSGKHASAMSGVRGFLCQDLTGLCDFALNSCRHLSENQESPEF